MHPYDKHCQRCGATIAAYCEAVTDFHSWNKLSHVCPLKPPQTPGEGAAVAFGLMGMAEAIGENWRVLAVKRRVWETDPSLYDCNCPTCDAYMKARDVGQDERTLYEFCGACHELAALHGVPENPRMRPAQGNRENSDG